MMIQAIQTADCRFHGHNVLEPRHLDTHHLAICPPEPHCPYCWHGYPLRGCLDEAHCEVSIGGAL